MQSEQNKADDKQNAISQLHNNLTERDRLRKATNQPHDRRKAREECVSKQIRSALL